MHERAGTPAQPQDLIDVDALLGAYYDLVPDPANPDQQVVFGTSGHRGSAFDTAFNEAHIVATTAAIVEYRTAQGTNGPLFLGIDTHALSGPAAETAIEVLAAAEVDVRVDARGKFTPTPSVSRAILVANGAATPQGLRLSGPGLADGIVVTPSHNPPRDGGFKYNPPHGGPADTDATSWIAKRANEIMTGGGWKQVKRIPYERARKASNVSGYDFMAAYVAELPKVIDLDAIRDGGVRIGADPLGGAAVDYWGAIGEEHRLDLTVVNPNVDPTWRFMTLDWDGKIRMDCSSPSAMASLRELMAGDAPYDIATGNDADADRHGIVTRDGGLMNPNHYLAAAISYLYGGARPAWSDSARIGKTLVSSSLIDRVGRKIGRTVEEVPVGFKWFVPGLMDGTTGFGGEESAGASFLTREGRVWTTDKDGILLCLLASEITGATGTTPSQIHAGLTSELGESWYARVDAAATKAEKDTLKKLSPSQVRATELAGQGITAKLTEAPGNGAAIGGLKVTTADAWFAARPSGTEDVYKIYAESFVSEAHLGEVQDAAKKLVSEALDS
ncbi:phosphoglucomutase (alpha-D-glucose-1,6-bisphosphate-dependent) [Demequina sp. NBRC 110057]|uniref:phosphoglucomutase (alpha-D-glucose-1,6-bisphosphate-dependent) n=1 Tax=Demequina sp. NBRC 110057 TaxID=1570346 RepID=UPI0009FD1A05|nr:phosphoglucomutase (alpha-D-glucose-1,6-bisphosphate-dependent) [Demequina sp. NBRC 110057]